MQGIKSKLSMLWIFYMFNQVYGDIGTLYNAVYLSPISTIHYTQEFFLGGAILVEIPMAMILLSRMLKHRANRLTNIIVGISLTGVNALTLFVGTPTLAYLFISIVSIVTSAAIVWFAWKWTGPETRTGLQITP